VSGTCFTILVSSSAVLTKSFVKIELDEEVIELDEEVLTVEELVDTVLEDVEVVGPAVNHLVVK